MTESTDTTCPHANAFKKLLFRSPSQVSSILVRNWHQDDELLLDHSPFTPNHISSLKRCDTAAHMATVEYAFLLCANVLSAIFPSSKGCSKSMWQRWDLGMGLGGVGMFSMAAEWAEKLNCAGEDVYSHIQERNITEWTDRDVEILD